MAIAAAHELAAAAEQNGIHEEYIVPRMDEWEVVPRIAVATAMKAQEQGVAQLHKTRDMLYDDAAIIIRNARETTHVLMREGLISSVENHG